MKKVLVMPDIHGRKFWKNPCKKIENYDRVIFLGDYFDPYGFENISVPDCIENFKEILDLKKKYNDKVVLLIGNHDLPYVSKYYYSLSFYHCRHSMVYHSEIEKLFNENMDLFKLAYVEDDILFTHAGVEREWLTNVVKCNETNIKKICRKLNTLLNDNDGLKTLYCITDNRGGRDKCGSCVWSDVHDMIWDTNVNGLENVKQVFGHTLQAFYDKTGKIVFGDAIEFDNCKMLDTADAYELDCVNFTIKKIT